MLRLSFNSETQEVIDMWFWILFTCFAAVLISGLVWSYPGFVQWRELRAVQRKLEQGGYSLAGFVYNRLRTHPEEFSVENLSVYGSYVVHNARGVAVSLVREYHQASVLADVDGIGTFPDYPYEVGVLLGDRVDEWFKTHVSPVSG